jgi:hypothetical protein
MTYASRIRSLNDPKHPCNRSFPGPPKISQGTLDAIAEKEFQKKIFGGLTKKQRKNLCPRCNIVMSATNICDFCE